MGHSRGSSHGGSRIIRYLYDKAAYPEFMDAAYAKWDALAKAEETTLYQKCPLININKEDRNKIYLEILEKFGRKHRLLSASQFNKEFSANLRYNFSGKLHVLKFTLTLAESDIGIARK